MRYVVVGAGAIGGTLAGRLAQHSPHPPLLVARGANADAIERRGLRLRSPDDDTTVRVDVVRGPDEADLRDDDVLVLATKTQQADVALHEWVDRPVRAAGDAGDPGRVVGTAGELLPVVVATNGVEAERLALRLFARVVAACVWLPAAHLEPGEVVVRLAPSSGTFIVGPYPAPTAQPGDAGGPHPTVDRPTLDRPTLDRLAADWGAATFDVRVVDDAMRWKHGKLLSNLANGLTALAGPQAPVGPLARRLRAEAEDVFRAAGVRWAGADEEAVWRGDAFGRRTVPGVDADRLGGSTWQSLARGAGSVETDYLNGEIVLLAREHGLAAPLNATVQRLVREAAAAGRGPGGTSVADLAAALGPEPASGTAPRTRAELPR